MAAKPGTPSIPAQQSSDKGKKTPPIDAFPVPSKTQPTPSVQPDTSSTTTPPVTPSTSGRKRADATSESKESAVMKPEEVKTLINEINALLKNLDNLETPTYKNRNDKVILTIGKEKLLIDCLLHLINTNIFGHKVSDKCDSLKPKLFVKDVLDPNLLNAANINGLNDNQQSEPVYQLYEFTMNTLKRALKGLNKYLQFTSAEAKSSKKQSKPTIVASDINKTVKSLKTLITFTLRKGWHYMSNNKVYGGKIH